jgi:hypothetical protein
MEAMRAQNIFLAVVQFVFSPSPPPKEERVGVRRHYVFKGLIFKCLPLTPALSPFGGVRESDTLRHVINIAEMVFFHKGSRWGDH